MSHPLDLPTPTRAKTSQALTTEEPKSSQPNRSSQTLIVRRERRKQRVRGEIDNNNRIRRKDEVKRRPVMELTASKSKLLEDGHVM